MHMTKDQESMTKEGRITLKFACHWSLILRSFLGHWSLGVGHFQ
jgi:hypothetical protein